MSTISLRLQESLHRRVRELAQREAVSINQFIATALAEKLSALLTGEYLEERAKRGDRRKFMRVLAKVRAARPATGDDLGGKPSNAVERLHPRVTPRPKHGSRRVARR